MKAKISRTVLLEHLKQIESFVGRFGLYYQNTVKLRVASADLALATQNDQGSAMVKTTEITASEDGLVQVPYATLAELVNTVPVGTDITLHGQPDSLKLTWRENKKARQATLKGDILIDAEIPEGWAGDEEAAILLQPLTRNLIKGTSFAAAKDDSRPALAGIYVEATKTHIKLVACDGIQLAIQQQDAKLPREFNALVPIPVAQAVSRALSDLDEETGYAQVVLYPSKIQFYFSDGLLITSQLIDLNYINYASVIPTKAAYSATLDTKKLGLALKGALIIAKNNANSLRFQTIDSEDGKRQVKISGEDLLGNKFRATLEALDSSGDVSEGFAVNGRFLHNAIKRVPGDTVVMAWTDDRRGILCTVPGSLWQYVLMPITLASYNKVTGNA
jgi:DNA polymerase III sliding clamp (beta) subunit (PCNA family)